jgi:murein DD-endopeptidase MepM/ murein hydrolase activator NlpD
MKVNGHFGDFQKWRTIEHRGTDYDAAIGTPVHAVLPGTVVEATNHGTGGYGNFVTIQHSDTLFTRYAHASNVEVQVGQHVEQGQEIMKSGKTGFVTGPHLHFEVLTGGIARPNARNAEYWYRDGSLVEAKGGV